MEIKKKSMIEVGILIVMVLILVGYYGFSNNTEKNNLISPYAGQELEREIKALSQDDVNGLLNGEGTPFGGMAKPAELNGYPGPRHVLDAHNAGEFKLEDKQYEQINKLYEDMKTEAIELGKQIINLEEEIDNSFVNKIMTEEFLDEKISKSAELYGKLRFVHLKYHLYTTEILTSDQIKKYNELRGYTSNKNPCEYVPEGHNPGMWKLHNNCN